MSTLKFYKNSDCNEVTEERLQYLRNQVKHLENEPQPEQRTAPWYEMRNGMLTASDWGVMLGDNPYSNPDDLILKKCGHEKPFKAGPAILWGVKYEEVAVQIYEYRNKVKVTEFGLIQHPTIKYLGASPDGITEDGVMLEIKCPTSRKITGVPPRYYFDQVQGQLEVCELDRCDFLECKLKEYEDPEEYYNDHYNGDHFYNSLGYEKGILAEFFHLKDKSLKFEYGPIGGDKETVEKWENDIKEKYKDLEDFAYIGLSYWHLVEVSCVPIYRDKEWFAEAKIKLKEFWDKILYYRENGVDEILNKQLEESNKRKKKKESKKVKQIFIDTTIDDFSGDMNSDALFDKVNSKGCLFSDDEDDTLGDKDKNSSKNDNSKKDEDNDNVFTFKKHEEINKENKENKKEVTKSITTEEEIQSDKESNNDEFNECLFSDED